MKGRMAWRLGNRARERTSGKSRAHLGCVPLLIPEPPPRVAMPPVPAAEPPAAPVPVPASRPTAEIPQSTPPRTAVAARLRRLRRLPACRRSNRLAWRLRRTFFRLDRPAGRRPRTVRDAPTRTKQKLDRSIGVD